MRERCHVLFGFAKHVFFLVLDICGKDQRPGSGVFENSGGWEIEVRRGPVTDAGGLDAKGIVHAPGKGGYLFKFDKAVQKLEKLKVEAPSIIAGLPTLARANLKSRPFVLLGSEREELLQESGPCVYEASS